MALAIPSQISRLLVLSITQSSKQLTIWSILRTMSIYQCLVGKDCPLLMPLGSLLGEVMLVCVMWTIVNFDSNAPIRSTYELDHGQVRDLEI